MNPSLTLELLQLSKHCFLSGIFWLGGYLVFYATWHYLPIHERFGFFKTPEPEVHFQTVLLNWKIPFMWGMGTSLLQYLLGIQFSGHPTLLFQVPESWVVVHSANRWTDIGLAIIGFYWVDFTDYWAHRFNHMVSLLYNKFPFGHFVHHNYVFLNPLVVAASPFIHLTAISGMIVFVIYLSQGLYFSIFLIHIFKLVGNFGSHLGFDPLPWLTRLNHRLGGWLPWIPLHHQYHHLPFASPGNYGNITCLWDYVFGTVNSESIYHIEQGSPLPDIALKIKDPEAMQEFLKDKTAFNLV
ncbi:MAG: sterol desaturase family protein [Cyanobacteriota bacterium]|nr:sterol desaturase family protein [Cyanobacteriota bacterium]